MLDLGSSPCIMDTDFIKHLPEDFTQDFRFSFEGVDDPAQYFKEKLGAITTVL